MPYCNYITYSATDFYEITKDNFDACYIGAPSHAVTWVRAVGLQNTAIIEQLGKHYNLHPLTIEDILNVDQRPKVEEFNEYYFITLKMLHWSAEKNVFLPEQLSIVLGKNFVLSFQIKESEVFDNLLERLRSSANQRLRQQGADYLAYRLIDIIVDNYFLVLEQLADEIEKVQEQIISDPTAKNSKMLYHLQRQILMLRKAIWPMREAISHLSREEEGLITSFTRVYLRDIYDHTVQAIDILETFRDMLSGMLDIYLTSLTNRMNEIMKILTIISTIFIPMTFIASIYGMNFQYMPELHWRFAYPAVLSVMLLISIIMLLFFRKKAWI